MDNGLLKCCVKMVDAPSNPDRDPLYDWPFVRLAIAICAKYVEIFILTPCNGKIESNESNQKQ